MSGPIDPRRWDPSSLRAAFNPSAEHPGGRYTCRFFGQRMGGSTVWCEKPGHEHVRSQADRGCAFWQREPGADVPEGDETWNTTVTAKATRLSARGAPQDDVFHDVHRRFLFALGCVKLGG